MLNEEKIIEKIDILSEKIDLIYDFLEDALLTHEESALINETDNLIKNKKYDELTALDDFIRFFFTNL